MKNLLLRPSTALLLAALAAPGAAAQSYNFESDAQGWKIFNVGMGGNYANVTPLQLAPWVAEGGLTGGCLRVLDIESETCIGAPAEALGNRSDLYGLSINYDALYRTEDNAEYSAVVIAGANFSIFFPHAKPHLNAVEHFEIPLTETGWHVGDDGGLPATKAQFQAVLSNVKGIYIRTEWTTGPDDTSVDNIRIGTACVADLTGDGTVDLLDFFQFFNCWDLSAPCADIDGNPGVDLGDFFEFFNHFDISC